MHLNQKQREILKLVLVFLLVLIVSALIVYFLGARVSDRATLPPGAQEPASSTQVEPKPEPTVVPREERSRSVLDQIFAPPAREVSTQPETWGEIALRTTVRFLIAALLGAVLAFRPRRKGPIFKRNPFVAQTQILLAVVASALMMIVGDSAARAFGIFAAVSLVRFRTNIRDPKEITVLLISLAIGLATGVGRLELALSLAVFAVVVLWILEIREPEQVFRSMDLAVATSNVSVTYEALKESFKEHGFDAEMRGIARENGEEGKVLYSVDLDTKISTDELSEEIFARDSTNIKSIEWEQKKNSSYVYQ